MNFSRETAELFIPDGLDETEALTRTTHLAIGAHQDDLEIMAYDGILKCFQRDDQWYTGVVVTNGAGSSRTGVYADYTDEEMVVVRNKEQKKAAVVGEFSAQFLLDHPSANLKSAAISDAADDIFAILDATRPEVVYTHNFADKHDTHVGVTLKVLDALRRMPMDARPKKVYGCEVWRDLDWMVDSDKVAFDVSAHPNLHAALVGVFDSQIAGGKRYDLATTGRCRAHATYHESHGSDETTGTTFAMDLTPLIENDALDPLEYTQSFVARLSADIEERFNRVT
jgi:LmbE family N-acetylglucosaminyl deacetylase